MGFRVHYNFYKSLRYIFILIESLQYYFGLNIKCILRKSKIQTTHQLRVVQPYQSFFFGYKLRKQWLPLLIYIFCMYNCC